MIRYLVGDVHEQLATLEAESIDLVVTSPPFLALRSYLPADHPDKSKEIGSEATPAEFLDTLLRVTQELRRVLAPHGSIAIELGDTFAGSGGAGGDYAENGLREGQPRYKASDARKNARVTLPDGRTIQSAGIGNGLARNIDGWPLPKSRALIPELYRIALAYGINPLTGIESPAGRWRVRNVVTWCRPNPPVGALGDKWRPATSDIVIACTSGKRYWDDLATRQPHQSINTQKVHWQTDGNGREGNNSFDAERYTQANPAGAPLLDYWVIPPTGYRGAHYAVYPPEIVVPLVKAMCPERVCRTCGEPSRRITEVTGLVNSKGQQVEWEVWKSGISDGKGAHSHKTTSGTTTTTTVGWTDCGHKDYRPGRVLDPFAGSGTTLMVAHGHGRDTIGIDLDERNLELTRERIGPMFEIGVS